MLPHTEQAQIRWSQSLISDLIIWLLKCFLLELVECRGAFLLAPLSINAFPVI